MSDPLDPRFVQGLRGIPLDELRRRRDVANERETVYSYVRRLVQGPLDIVGAELERRRSGAPAGDVADLVEKLPGILGDQIHAPGLGRLSPFLAPGDVDEALVSRIDGIVTTDELSELAALDDDRLASLLEELAAFEREISGTRRAVQQAVDQVKAELVRRYREGEASADTLS